MAWRSGSASVWRERLERQGVSGQSVVRFCARERVSTASFYRWRRLLGNELPLEAGAAFRRIEVGPIHEGPAGGVGRGGMVVIAFGCGARVEIPCDATGAVGAAVAALANSGRDDEDAIGGTEPC